MPARASIRGVMVAMGVGGGGVSSLPLDGLGFLLTVATPEHLFRCLVFSHDAFCPPLFNCRCEVQT